LALGLNKKRLDERNHGLSRLLELGCDARDLRALGYNATELCHSGIKALDLIKAGFDIPTVLRESSWSTTTDLEMWSTGNYFEDLKGVLKACGFGPLQIRRAMLEEQKRVAREKSENLKRFPEHRKEIRELFRPGFAGRLFNLLDYTAADAKRVHIPAEELFYGKFSAEELANGGYSLQ
jgi:hypothetical protein